MERFVKHTRKPGELLDLPTASDNYLIFFKTAVPALESWQVVQVKQALELFARGTEGWRWLRQRILQVTAFQQAGTMSQWTLTALQLLSTRPQLT